MLEYDSLTIPQEEDMSGVNFTGDFKRKAQEVARELGEGQVAVVENGFFVSKSRAVEGYQAIAVIDLEEGGQLYVLQRKL